jgi:hypothetical protein
MPQSHWVPQYQISQSPILAISRKSAHRTLRGHSSREPRHLSQAYFPISIKYWTRQAIGSESGQ